MQHPSSKTILAIYAHPDDEAFGTGGMLARYASEGHTVKLICATRGESGKITDPSIPADTPMGALREQELKNACAALGIDAPIFLNYHDSGRHERAQDANPQALMHADPTVLAQELLTHIQTIHPHIIITFDPHGIYGHIDHLIIHRAATAAFWASGGFVPRAPQRLYYNIMPLKKMEELQAMRPNSPLSQLEPRTYGASSDSIAIEMDITPWFLKKVAAIQAHRSQVGPNSSFADPNNPEWQQLFSQEYLALGGLRGPYPAMPQSDILVGLEEV